MYQYFCRMQWGKISLTSILGLVCFFQMSFSMQYFEYFFMGWMVYSENAKMADGLGDTTVLWGLGLCSSNKHCKLSYIFLHYQVRRSILGKNAVKHQIVHIFSHVTGYYTFAECILWDWFYSYFHWIHHFLVKFRWNHDYWEHWHNL